MTPVIFLSLLVTANAADITAVQTDTPIENGETAVDYKPGDRVHAPEPDGTIREAMILAVEGTKVVIEHHDGAVVLVDKTVLRKIKKHQPDQEAYSRHDNDEPGVDYGGTRVSDKAELREKRAMTNVGTTFLFLGGAGVVIGIITIVTDALLNVMWGNEGSGVSPAGIAIGVGGGIIGVSGAFMRVHGMSTIPDKNDSSVAISPLLNNKHRGLALSINF